MPAFIQRSLRKPVRKFAGRLRALRRVSRGRSLRPLAHMPVLLRDIVLGTTGMAFGLLVTVWITRLATGDPTLWWIGPMGTTALLLFFVPASPLVRPWAVIGGHLVSALVGLGMHQALPATAEVGVLAGVLAAVAMFALRCLHPPGIAIAVISALEGTGVPAPDWLGVVWPVLVGSVVMVALGLAFNRLLRRGHAPRATARRGGLRRQPLGLLSSDIEAALASFGEPLDIDPRDLEEVLRRAELNARRRQAGLR
ncbi:HPP family protein [Ramlibacter rhizophilus]|uniref:HPP family protein n=1 Tax=Ramlibacter rhizophilus TaxID=1781167 RepID=A0A4Z0BYJ6_9BURK|nr:HPP family protein [Ramlibacter rhizophilus]TFZ04323.1 HPP family protein [Ramlibacter rhizophilus]